MPTPRDPSELQATPDLPAAVQPYVRAIGRKIAAQLFLGFGGTLIYVSGNPRAGSPLVAAIGREATTSLFREFGSGHLKVPMAKAWTARQLEAHGVSRADIARRLHVTRESVRGYLGPVQEGRRSPGREDAA